MKKLHLLSASAILLSLFTCSSFGSKEISQPINPEKVEKKNDVQAVANKDSERFASTPHNVANKDSERFASTPHN